MNHVPRLEFWFDFASTYSYLSAMRIAELARHRKVEVIWKPFLLGPVFKAQGWDTSPFNIYPAKGRYMWRDIERQAMAYGIAFKRPEDFPQFAITATRVCVAASDRSWHDEFCRQVFTAEYADGGDISSADAIANALEKVGADPSTWLEKARQPDIKQALRTRVDAAMQAGIFGAPTFVTPDAELFWGDDRLEAALAWATR